MNKNRACNNGDTLFDLETQLAWIELDIAKSRKEYIDKKEAFEKARQALDKVESCRSNIKTRIEIWLVESRAFEREKRRRRYDEIKQLRRRKYKPVKSTAPETVVRPAGERTKRKFSDV